VKCIVPGSYDPVTVGHLDIIARAAQIFDEVWAVVFANSDKRTAFSGETRLKMLAAACVELPNVKAAVSEGMLVDFMRENEIKYIVKGVRDSSDFDYEYKMANINHAFYAEAETVFLPSRPELQHISSTVVRELIKYGKPLDGYVPAPAIKVLKTENTGVV
jgi:pantetheine-phosphate adenylyltransferase